MIQTSPTLRILVAVEPVDFRRGIDGLAAICRQQLARDPMNGWAFVFRNRSKTAVKILLYDGQQPLSAALTQPTCDYVAEASDRLQAGALAIAQSCGERDRGTDGERRLQALPGAASGTGRERDGITHGERRRQSFARTVSRAGREDQSERGDWKQTITRSVSQASGECRTERHCRLEAGASTITGSRGQRNGISDRQGRHQAFTKSVAQANGKRYAKRRDRLETGSCTIPGTSCQSNANGLVWRRPVTCPVTGLRRRGCAL